MINRVLPIALLVACAACTPGIHQLVAEGDLEALRSRLDRFPEEREAPDDLQKTPLHKAITFDRTEIFDLLVERGADLNAHDATGMRPLHVAAALNRPDYARKLIALGADIEALDLYGDTPLHTAAMFGAVDTIEVLIHEGADALATNDEALTPAGLARKHHRTRLADQLDAYMSNRKGITDW